MGNTLDSRKSKVKSMEKFSNFSSILVPFPHDNVDTDQIYPARFLTATDRANMADKLFVDLRQDEHGNPRPDFVLNMHQYREAKILLGRDNFGSGSSREHAVWALRGWGFRAVFAMSFGDIFKNNCYKNGLLPIALPKDIIAQMNVDAAADPQEKAMVDLEQQTVQWKGRAYRFEIHLFAKACMLKGVDEIGYTLSFEKEISTFEAIHE